MRTFLTALVALVTLPAIAQADPTGVWLRANAQGEESKVDVTQCTTTKLCGTIVYMQFPRLDDRNINPLLRDRELVGLEIFNDVVEVSTDVYAGTVYNPEVGFTLSGTVTQIDNDTLSLEGCFLGYCQTDTWTRSQL